MQVRHLVAKIGTNANGITFWPNLEPMIVLSNLELILVEPHTIGFLLAGDITQVKESIPWVRCVSGNV